MTAASITAVPGIRVGHWTDRAGLTGCTVVLCPEGTIGSGDVRGGAPGTRETDLLGPGRLVHQVNAVLLTGGSAFGLAAADGVMRYLEERGIGYPTPQGPVPIVPAAVLFDLGCGDARARPGPEQGYAACLAAGQEVPEGNHGAGAGATVATLWGPEGAVKGGVGTAARRDGDLVVGALAAVNARGEVLDEDGSVLAGSRLPPPETPDTPGTAGTPPPETPDAAGGSAADTTLVVVATNAALSRDRAHLLARASHDGLSGAIRPAHTMWDGDTVFTLATGPVEAGQRAVESMAVDAVMEAIRRAVLLAEGVPDFPSAREGSKR